MQAPDSIQQVWRTFDGIPMETFTKGWWHQQCGGSPRQRTVAELEEHRRTLGAGGNCFDLSVWLLHRFKEAGIPARMVGHDLETEDAHVAVVAAGPDGAEYLCDLGDLWLQPVRISHPVAPGWFPGFFPGREVRILRESEQHLTVEYRRTSGKIGRQSYDLALLTEKQVATACHHNQNLLRRPFCEALRIHPESGRIEHWEYDRGRSFWNLPDGPVFEEPSADWTARISAMTGIAPEIINTAFAVYGVTPPQ